MVGIIVVILSFLPRILYIVYFDIEALLVGNLLHLLCQLGDVVNLLKLVESSIFACLRRIFNGNGETLHGIPERQKSSSLMPLAIGREGHADYRLGTIPVNGRAEALVKIKSGKEAFIMAHLINTASEYHPLHDVC